MKFTLFMAAIATVSAVTLEQKYAKIVDINYDDHLASITSGTYAHSNNEWATRSKKVADQAKEDSWRAVQPWQFGP